MSKTMIGKYEIANAKFNNDGSENLVRKYIAITAKKFPMTGNAEDKATCWFAANTDVITFNIICKQKHITNTCTTSINCVL